MFDPLVLSVRVKHYLPVPGSPVQFGHKKTPYFRKGFLTY